MRRRVVFAVTNDDRGNGALRKFSKDDVGSRQQMDGGRDDADAIFGRHQAKRGLSAVCNSRTSCTIAGVTPWSRRSDRTWSA